MGKSDGRGLTAKQQEWLEHIRRCESLGGTMRGYAEARGLELRTFYSWKYRLGKLGVLERKESPGIFRRVALRMEPSSAQAVRVRLPNGVVIEAEAGLDVHRLSALVKLLG